MLASPPPWHTPASAVAHARLRLSRLELIGGSGRTAGRYASAARAFISPTAFEQLARGGALGAVESAGSGSLGVVFSESAAGFGGLRWLGGLRARRAVVHVYVFVFFRVGMVE